MNNKIKELMRLQDISDYDYNATSLKQKSLKQFVRLLHLESSKNRLIEPYYRQYLMTTPFYQKIKNIK